MTDPEANVFDLPHLERFKKIPLDSHLVEREALVRGLETLRVSPLHFSAWAPGRMERIGFYRTCGDANSRVAMVTTMHKQVTRTLLQRAGVAVPEGRKFTLDQRDQAIKYGHELGWPLVVKPQSGTAGTGVTTGITSDEELGWAIDALAETQYNELVVERHVDGEAYRFMVLRDRVLSVVARRPASVVGDGVSTVADLVERQNDLRKRVHKLQTLPRRINDRVRFQLERQGLGLESVPEAGLRVFLSTAGSRSQGGDSFEVMAETHPSLLDMAVRAVRAIPGMWYAGVDFLIVDHRRPIDEQSAAICEINATPASGSHHFPLFGTPRNVSLELVSAQCGLAGVPLKQATDTLCLDLQVRGTVQGVGYRRWMTRLARTFDISGWVRNGAEPDLVESRLAGDAGRVAALASLAIEGPRRAAPEAVRTRHFRGDVPTGSFGVIDEHRPRTWWQRLRLPPSRGQAV